MGMILQSALLRGSGLVEKHERIAMELDRFRTEALVDGADLPREVRAILGHIHENLFDPDLNVEAVKARCRTRNNNVSTRFRLAIGVSIREYIEGLRLGAASHLLRQEGLEISLIGLVVGYQHQETFCRAFHRLFGCSPSEHRRSLVREDVKRKSEEERSTAPPAACS